MLTLNDPSLFREQCYVNGQWIDADDKSVIKVDNPSKGEIIGSVPKFGAAETRRAIDAAEAAWAGWRALTPKERGAYLIKWNDLIQENKQDLARILSYEQGKPVAESLGEIALGSSYIPWYAEECRRTYGDVIPAPRKGIRPITHHQPVGVVFAITPWNFPMSMITRKTAPALAAGCPVLVKPASATPYSALALAELAHRAGFPAGVFNVLTGSASVMAGEMASNVKVRKVTFTGSTEVGKKLTAQTAQTMKRVSMELGGNAPFVVFDDADLALTLNCAYGSKIRNAGQTCISTNRILVQEGIAQDFVTGLVERFKTLRVGDGFEDNVEVGPLINQSAVEHCEALLADAVSKGAKILLGGKRHALGGNFFEPTVLTGMTREMRIFHEEIFGPIAPIMTFASEAEAVELANDTPFGLASYVFTQNLSRAWRIPEALEYGLCGVNDAALALAEAPFGGVKESGTGREGGREGLLDFMETRYVLMGGIGA
ncbi:MAG: succinate-semialdehyde dehydrogenase (NADP(+)) [Desulfovibrio sp. MES5]|uniref:NAD-dependent succinate-semialdehyde dehydrogenase n=1 Tax=Desulfovibrio sp. MES5 TaxID=1899016 RepID=UPI000B9CE35E|nr:NAD-dependent succinate-semialdehyde dehydrogenase [Desulfovibrio sp. MES5]OXS28033.1 MAG: succinate-semialdehyde dehydrogenase (NADP(+)) [Desulfovibrio sp. MES5]